MDVGAVVFDMDGVLIDTERIVLKCWKAAGRESGYEIPEDLILRLRSLSREDSERLMKRELGEGFDFAGIRERRRRMTRAYAEEVGMDPKPGVREIVSYLRGRGIPYAIATARDEESARFYLRNIDAEGLFDRVVSARSVPRGKPAPDVYEHVCRAIGRRPEECIAVEDSPNGVRSASAAGCRVVMVPDLTEPDRETEGLLYAKCATLFDVIGLLERRRARIPCRAFYIRRGNGSNGGNASLTWWR